MLLDKPDALSAAQLAGLRADQGRFAEWCDQLAATGVAASLQHDDLHDANIFVPYDGVGPYRVFDWGDASVAHPFTTLLVTLRVVAYRLELTGGAAELLRLRDAYLEPWTGEHDRATLVEAVPTGAADRSGRARPLVAEVPARRDAVGARAPRGRDPRLAGRARQTVAS